MLLSNSCKDEPAIAKPISCQAHYTDDIYGEYPIAANFFLFPGSGYVAVDRESFGGLLRRSVEAIRADGSRQKNIGFCQPRQQRATISPVYNDGANEDYRILEFGTFTIMCEPTAKGRAACYKMKVFTKKVDELIMIDAYFTPESYEGKLSEWKLIPWD